MSGKKRECPDCQASLETVLLSDLIGERKEQALSAVLPAAGAIFEHFDFYVCGQCGRTLVYAGSEAREAAKKKGSEK
ncbi:MAG TPA: hypothetical protein VGN95_05175 [Pyrinomonadaceae bacterium]|nr:hypothetical protein [Pyrinomonadaceae bacterium]